MGSLEGTEHIEATIPLVCLRRCEIRQNFPRATQIILNGPMRLLLMEFADPHQVVQRCFVVVAQLVPS
jgi:hypothetical protein